jgi:hypothetical protein
MPCAIQVSGARLLDALRDDFTSTSARIIGFGQFLSPAMASARFLSVKPISRQVPET